MTLRGWVHDEQKEPRWRQPTGRNGKRKGKLQQSVLIISHGERENNMSEIRESEGFVIDSDAKALWALQKIKEARADRDTWVAWYQQKIKEITEQTDFDTMNLERMLADYFATVPHKTTKTQESYTLPCGKLILKKQNPEYTRDDKTVIEWLKANKMPQFVKVKEELDWSGLKAATGVFEGNVVTEDGEIIPGITVTDREAKFVVEV